MSEQVGRNDPCPCGSGKKYKKCCAMKEGMQKHSASVITGSANSLLGRISDSGKAMSEKLSEKKIAPMNITKQIKKEKD